MKELFDAYKEGNLEKVEELVKAGTYVNAKDRDVEDIDDDTPRPFVRSDIPNLLIEYINIKKSNCEPKLGSIAREYETKGLLDYLISKEETQ